MRPTLIILLLILVACGGSAATEAIPASTVAPPDMATLATATDSPALGPTAPPTTVRTPAPGSSSPVRPPTIAPVVEAQGTGATVSNTMDVLTERVEDALDLAFRGNWLEAWEYFTLSFRESCPKESFAAQAAFGMNLFRGMVDLPPNEPLEFRLMSISIQGATAVSTQIFHQGEPLAYGAKDELDAWVLIDGQWWNNVPPGPEGCVN